LDIATGTGNNDRTDTVQCAEADYDDYQVMNNTVLHNDGMTSHPVMNNEWNTMKTAAYADSLHQYREIRNLKSEIWYFRNLAIMESEISGIRETCLANWKFLELPEVPNLARIQQEGM
jgi:hypothetical protein